MAWITFIIPAYNAEKYIGRCLDSVCCQTVRDISVIVVDDGSMDQTCSVVERYMQRDARIKLICQDNEGPNQARWTGLQHASTEYVMMIDSDDWIAPDTAEYIETILKKDSIDMIVPGMYFAYKDHVEYHGVDAAEYHGLEYLDMLMEERVPHNLASCLYRRELFEEAPWDVMGNLYMGDDLALNIFLASKGPKVRTVDRGFYYYYQNPTSMSHVNYDKIARIYDTLFVIKNYLREQGLLEQYTKQMDFLYYLHGIHYHGIMPFQRDYQVRRKLRKQWKEQGISIYENPCYQSFVKRQPFSKKVFMVAYRYSFHLNYILGAVIMPVFNFVKKR